MFKKVFFLFYVYILVNFIKFFVKNVFYKFILYMFGFKDWDFLKYLLFYDGCISI